MWTGHQESCSISLNGLIGQEEWIRERQQIRYADVDLRRIVGFDTRVLTT